MKMVKQRCRQDVRNYFFSERVTDRWHKLSKESVESNTINGLKQALEKERKR